MTNSMAPEHVSPLQGVYAGSMVRYLAVRTDKQRRPFVLRELQSGRLRQGRGWRPEHDLRLLRQKLSAGATLAEEEGSVWRNRRLLDTEPDGTRAGDMLVLPNLPEQGRWLLARVTGPYHFEFPPEQEAGRDYGHIVPVEVVRLPEGDLGVIEADNEHVHGGLRASMQARSRLWSVDRWKEPIDRLLSLLAQGVHLSAPAPPEHHNRGFAEDMRRAAWSSIRTHFHGAKFEGLVVALFEKLYPDASVDHIGGAGEQGADLLVTTRDVLGFETKIAVQVKMYEGTHDDLGALDQLRTARRMHQVDAGVVVSTATTLSERFEAERAALEKEMPVRVLYGLELTNLLLTHLVGTASVEESNA
jgi:hypothetical protein